MSDSPQNARKTGTSSGRRSPAGADALSPGEAIREAMETVVLPPRPGAARSDAPAIEIYLGTEPAQFRANRVFGWSIEKVRDPGREVRIHVMSELPGFRRRFWTTGFTNYRFAIPAFQAGRGRALYNDEDEIYLTDPGALFDLPIGEAGYLATSDTESSVMLIDCERMASVWSLDEAQRGWKRDLLRKATRASGHRGELDPHWNARDEEFEPGRSHLLHYTTLHTQPWRPFPERFVYQEGAYTALWHELEREAIEAGFEMFSQERPSRAFLDRLSRLEVLPQSELGSALGVAAEVTSSVETLVHRTKARTLVELQPDLRGDQELSPGRFGLESERRLGLFDWLSQDQGEAVADGVVCVEDLESLPVWDLPWIVESLFRRARRFVFVAVRTPEKPPRRRFLLPPQGTTHTLEWWRAHFEAASVRHPDVSWELAALRGGRLDDASRVTVALGGRRPDDTPPRVWTLSDGNPGNERQVEALAQALGWPAESKRLTFGLASSLPFAATGAHLRGLAQGTASLEAPWPDLLIVAGRRAAPVARWIRMQARGRTRVVALGAKTATPADAVDLAVTPSSANLFPHPRRLEIAQPLVGTATISQRWRERVDQVPGRKLVLVIGSGAEDLGLDGPSAEALGRLVAESARSLGAAVLVSASRHARSELIESCLRGLGRPALVHRETPEQRPDERAWGAFLAAGEAFILVGQGETTLAELAATGRPLFLAPRRDVQRNPWSVTRDAVRDLIVERAKTKPANDRGTTRPQEGLELLCARLIDRGHLRPRRDSEGLRGQLVRAGHARLLRAPIRAGDLEGFVPAPADDIARVAQRVRRLLGLSEAGRD
jgi:mitochondrial fission protein ELM1